MIPIQRLFAGAGVAMLSLVVTAAPATADGRHRPRHRGRHGLELDREQRACLVRHGFGAGAARQDFHDPAVRARLVEALRECGVIGGTPTTTSTTSPIIIS